MTINIQSEAYIKAQAARKAAVVLANTSTQQRNEALLAMAAALISGQEAILAANARDIEAACAKGTPEPLIDRLLLTPERIAGIADAIYTLEKQEDPLGEVIRSHTMYNDIKLTQMRVPLGVVAIIYEARPNVTADAASLCIKTGNAAILRGGSLAINSNLAITEALRSALELVDLPKDALQSIEDTSHEAADELMALHGLIDVLIPRGGAGLIRNCVENSKVPVIETGTGNCHIYLHETADLPMAKAIVINAKTQRPGVCNAAESLLVDEAAAQRLLPEVLTALDAAGVKLHCDAQSAVIAKEVGIEGVIEASDEDWGREYLDLEMSVKCVSGLDEAIAHINRYGTGHSEAIVAQDEQACEEFLACIDAAAVYANASTRFTDGGEFGLGAEIGISTQKLHARGPMGLEALCSSKYIARGTGQVRA